MRKVRAEIVVQSHLSDSLIELGFNVTQVRTRLRFVKFVVSKCNGDLTQEIDPDVLFKEFSKLEKEESIEPELMESNELHEFVTPAMIAEINKLLPNQKLAAVKYLIGKAKKVDKKLGLKDAKDYIDSL